MITITEDDVKAAIGIDPASRFDNEWIATVVGAANAYIKRVRPDLTDADPSEDNSDVHLGLVILAEDWYHARGSKSAASFADFGPLPTLNRSLIESLLGIGRYGKPVIA